MLKTIGQKFSALRPVRADERTLQWLAGTRRQVVEERHSSTGRTSRAHHHAVIRTCYLFRITISRSRCSTNKSGSFDNKTASDCGSSASNAPVNRNSPGSIPSTRM